MEQRLQEANFLNITGQYDSAVSIYTELQQTGQQDNYEIAIAKAVALIQLNNFESALKECENAIVIDRKRLDGLYRRGICNFYTQKFKAALIDFEEVAEKNNKNPVLQKSIEAWIGKCNAELNNTNLDSLIEQGGIQPPQSVKQSQQQQTQQQQAAPVVQQKSDKIVYTWYQTDLKVGIEINFQLQDQKDLKVEFTSNSVNVSFPITASSNYDLSLDLFGNVKPDTAKYNLLLNKIEITVEKETKGDHWKQLNAPEKVEEEQKTQEQKKPQVQQPVKAAPFYPSSSKTKKDWSKIDAEIEEDISKNKEEYGEGDPLNNLFKQIYSGADENTRRAMIKSFQTSGGTVLSTNWDEVKSKDYEGKDRPSPPKGQKFAEWGKE